MLLRIETKNFRKLTDTVIDFQPGMSVLRAPNESGKSTLMEAVAYALFGSKALRTPLVDAVTWGQAESSLKVVLSIRIGDFDYTFSRAKTGAEVNYGVGNKVTGQNEVSNFAANLLGAEIGAATRLMMSNQGDLRGALSQGPKATMQMIETLSDFDVLDRLIEVMGERLLTGSATYHEEKLATMEAELATLQPPGGSLDAELKALRDDIDEKAGREETAKTGLREVLQPAYYAARNAHENASGAARMNETVVNNTRRARGNRAVHGVQRAEAEAKALLVPDEQRIRALKAQLSSAGEHAEKARIYSAFSELLYPPVFWEGTEEEYQAKIDSLRSLLKQATKATGGQATEIRVLEAHQIAASVCGFCNQDVSQFPEVAKKNADIHAKVSELRRGLAACNDMRKTYEHEEEDLRAVASAAKPFLTFLRDHGQYVTADLNFYPQKLAWRGEAPGAVHADEAALKREIEWLEAEREAAGKSRARAEALTQTLIEDDEYLDRLAQQLLEYPAIPNMAELYEAKVKAERDCSALTDEISLLQHYARNLEAKIQETKSSWQAYQDRVTQAQATLQQMRDEIAHLYFNNTLMKKVKAARPLIADKLWNTVLAAVSTFFSQMRGARSVVTKDKDGFKVDGQAVESLSGSTLDILGLAIRTALIKTFLPHCPFMLLDEPGAACDADRAAGMVGFVAASGFQQLLLVTHDEISESFADQLISL